MNKLQLHLQVPHRESVGGDTQPPATNAVTVNVAGDPGTDTINTEDSLDVTALTTVTLLDYATGKWMTL
jgi:hypothetical protein